MPNIRCWLLNLPSSPENAGVLWIIGRPGNWLINLSNPVEVPRVIEQRDWTEGMGQTMGGLLQRQISRNPTRVLCAAGGMRDERFNEQIPVAWAALTQPVPSRHGL